MSSCDFTFDVQLFKAHVAIAFRHRPFSLFQEAVSGCGHVVPRPTCQAQFSLLPCTTSSPASFMPVGLSSSRYRECSSHRLALASTASGATSSDGGLDLASVVRETYKVEEASADLLGFAAPRFPPRMRRPTDVGCDGRHGAIASPTHPWEGRTGGEIDRGVWLASPDSGM
jgi:hypothetical protein